LLLDDFPFFGNWRVALLPAESNQQPKQNLADPGEHSRPVPPA
jgi:hypothetical protein